MEETLSVPALSQGERVLDTFIAPTRTFTDILRSSTWWLPFLILVLATLASTFSIDRKVGFDAVAQQQMTKSKSAAEAMDQLPADQRAKRIQMSATITRGISYASFLPILIFVAIEAAVLLACFNFILGAKVTYGQTFAVIMYAGLPRIFIAVLTVVLLFAGVSTDGFDVQNPVGTNVGYYFSDSPILKAAGGFFDVFGLWSLALLVLGMAIISRKKIGQSAAIIVGFWVLFLVVMTGIAAATS